MDQDLEKYAEGICSETKEISTFNFAGPINGSMYLQRCFVKGFIPKMGMQFTGYPQIMLVGK